MAKQLLHDAYICAAIEQMRGIGMAKYVWANNALYSSSLCSVENNLPSALST
jgi:hypothetical protein